MLLPRFSPQQMRLAQQLARQLTDPDYTGQVQQQGRAEQNHLLVADPRLAEYLSAAQRATVLEQLANQPTVLESLS